MTPYFKEDNVLRDFMVSYVIYILENCCKKKSRVDDNWGVGHYRVILCMRQDFSFEDLYRLTALSTSQEI